MPDKHPDDGFTLVELLVVVGILSMLISLLLPSLNKARQAANRVACLANLRSLGQAMMIYTVQNSGYLPGSGMTSGRHLWQVVGGKAVPADSTPAIDVNGFAPGVNECADWAGPLARAMGYQSTELQSDTDPIARYRWYTEQAIFRCPSNEGALMTAGTGGGGGYTGLGVLAGMSYTAAACFLTIPYNTYPGNVSADGFLNNITWQRETSGGSMYGVAPDGYIPKISKLGKGSGKIFLADGAKRTYFTKGGTTAIWHAQQYVLGTAPADTVNTYSVFNDVGAFWGDSQSYHREAIPGNCDAGIDFQGLDGRLAAYRHGTQRPFAPAGSYLINAVFYDGHAESLDDLSASNPSLWVPKRTRFSNTTGGASNQLGGVKVIWTDYKNKFLPTATTLVVD